MEIGVNSDLNPISSNIESNLALIYPDSKTSSATLQESDFATGQGDFLALKLVDAASVCHGCFMMAKDF